MTRPSHYKYFISLKHVQHGVVCIRICCVHDLFLPFLDANLLHRALGSSLDDEQARATIVRSCGAVRSPLLPTRNSIIVFIVTDQDRSDHMLLWQDSRRLSSQVSFQEFREILLILVTLSRVYTYKQDQGGSEGSGRSRMRERDMYIHCGQTESGHS